MVNLREDGLRLRRAGMGSSVARARAEGRARSQSERMHASTALAGADLVLFVIALAYLRHGVDSRRCRSVIAGFAAISILLLSSSVWLSLS
jgi:hypothetical protein